MFGYCGLVDFQIGYDLVDIGVGFVFGCVLQEELEDVLFCIVCDYVEDVCYEFRVVVFVMEYYDEGLVIGVV